MNVTTFIVVKAGTVDVEKKQCWHRDINLSYVAGPDQHHVICLFPMFSPTPDDGCAGDFVVASHTGLPDPWVVAPMAPLDIGDVWLGNALTVHRGGICPTTNPHRPRVFGFISVGTSRFEYNNTCPVVVPPWAGKAYLPTHFEYTAVYSEVYGRILGGIRPYTHSICCQFQSILPSSLLEFHPFFPFRSSMIPGHCGASWGAAF